MIIFESLLYMILAWLIGSIISAFFDQSFLNEYERFALRIVIGIILMTMVFAIWRTGGLTIMSGFIVIGIFAFLQNRKNLQSFNKTRRSSSRDWLKPSLV